MNNFLENYKFKELIDTTFIKNIKEIFIEISYNNLLFMFFDKISILDYIQEEEELKKEFEKLGKKISYDFFMYYDCENIINKILHCLSEIKNIIGNNKVLYNIINLNKKINKYKTEFCLSYETYSKKYLEIYNINEVDLKVKFKKSKNPIISNFICELENIDSFN